MSDGEITILQRVDESRKLGRLDLRIAGERDDDPAPRPLEAGHERGRLAEGPRELDDLHAVALRGEALERGGDVRVGSVEHDDAFEGEAERLETPCVFQPERRHVAVAPDDGDED